MQWICVVDFKFECQSHDVEYIYVLYIAFDGTYCVYVRPFVMWLWNILDKIILTIKLLFCETTNLEKKM